TVFCLFVFFFQAEDGIRDKLVTGVQTCALPILHCQRTLDRGERGDSGVRSFASVQGALAMYPIYAFGSDEQKRRWLPKMASGERSEERRVGKECRSGGSR